METGRWREVLIAAADARSSVLREFRVGGKSGRATACQPICSARDTMIPSGPRT
jgi:hypothetical protein